MRLLVGLGNPGEEYVKTRHNIGFAAVDAVAEVLQAGNSRTFKGGELYEVGGNLIFKPMQFMNRSGQSIHEVKQYFQIEPTDVCIVADDVYVAPGSVRIRHSGGDGGHNGWKSIHDHLKDDTFLRVRIGVGVYEQH